MHENIRVHIIRLHSQRATHHGRVLDDLESLLLNSKCLSSGLRFVHSLRKTLQLFWQVCEMITSRKIRGPVFDAVSIIIIL